MAIPNAQNKVIRPQKFEVLNNATTAEDSACALRPRDLSSLWASGLSGSVMFSVTSAVSDPGAEREAQNIIARHLERQQNREQTVAMSEMVDFQRALQMRSKVVSAIEILMRG